MTRRHDLAGEQVDRRERGSRGACSGLRLPHGAAVGYGTDPEEIAPDCDLERPSGAPDCTRETVDALRNWAETHIADVLQAQGRYDGTTRR